MLVGLSNFDNVWAITSLGAGNVNGVVAFSPFEQLTGGALNDRFVFSNGAGLGATGVIRGGLGTDSLDYSAYTTPLTVNLRTVAAPGLRDFFDVENVVGSSSSGDTLIGRMANTTWQITADDAVRVAGLDFSSFENLQGGKAPTGLSLRPAPASPE